MARPLRGGRARRRDREAARPPVHARLARGGRQGEGAQDRRLRRRRRALEENVRRKLATLLLGLYREDGEVDYVGSAAIGARNHDEIAALVLPLLDERSDRRFSEPNRWGTDGLEETPLRQELVAEVRYDKVQGNRFRHGTKLIRFRPDKDPAQCTWREVRPARRADDPTVETLLSSAT